MLIAIVVAAALATPGCRGCEPGKPVPATSARSAATGTTVESRLQRPPPPATLKPLRAERDIVPLEVPGFGDAAVSVPRGATQPRPLIIALHGNFDRPEWQCRAWQDISGGYPWVLCPRGKRRADAPEADPRFTYGTVPETAKELRASLRRLKDKYVYHLAPGPVVLAGFSLGAIQATQIAKEEPSFFARVVLVEGGAAQWSSGTATIFRDGGGKKVVFACGQSACRVQAAGRVSLSRLLSLGARVVDGGNAGHVYDGAVKAGLREHYDWLVGDDPRFVPPNQ